MQLNGDLHFVNYGWCGQRGAIFCRLWYEREAGNKRVVSDFNIGHMTGVRYVAHVSKRINAIAKVHHCGPRFTLVQRERQQFSDVCQRFSAEKKLQNLPLWVTNRLVWMVEVIYWQLPKLPDRHLLCLPVFQSKKAWTPLGKHLEHDLTVVATQHKKLASVSDGNASPDDALWTLHCDSQR